MARVKFEGARELEQRFNLVMRDSHAKVGQAAYEPPEHSARRNFAARMVRWYIRGSVHITARVVCQAQVQATARVHPGAETFVILPVRPWLLDRPGS